MGLGQRYQGRRNGVAHSLKETVVCMFYISIKVSKMGFIVGPHKEPTTDLNTLCVSLVVRGKLFSFYIGLRDANE